jgi:hypothetical protein
MTFQEIIEEFDQLSIDEKLQVIEHLARSIRETLQSQTKSDESRVDEPYNRDNSSDTDAVTPTS